MKIQKSVFGLICTLVCLYSCNKNDADNTDNATPAKSCLVTSITYDSLTEFKYTYDEKRRIIMEASVNNPGGERIYVYGTASVTVDSRKITLNGKGNMVSCTIDDAPSDIHESYVYDASNRVIKRAVISSKGSFSYIYTWKSGNLLSIVGTNDNTKDTVSSFEYTYYDGMTNVLANHEKLKFFTGTQSKNLVKTSIGTFTGNPNKQILNYTYEFEADGKVSKMGISGTSLLGGSFQRSEEYKWNCD